MNPAIRIAFPGVLAASLALGAGPALADQTVKSSDGAWKVTGDVPATIAVKKKTEVIVDIAPVAGGSQCPKLASVAFEMPSHGHGGDVDPKAMSMGACSYHISDLVPSMDGQWRLRLVLKEGEKTSTADFAVQAK
jgi:hypothetical protein